MQEMLQTLTIAPVKELAPWVPLQPPGDRRNGRQRAVQRGGFSRSNLQTL